MEQAVASLTHSDDRNDAQDAVAEEVIDAVDHVLEALDQIIALTEIAFAEGSSAHR